MDPLVLDGLTKHYGDLIAAEDLTFTVEEGDIFGYLGPNGAGKTTTIRTLLGFLSPTTGTARVLGADIRDRNALVDVKHRIGYLSDEPGFDEQATGREIIDLHAAIKGDKRSQNLLEYFDPPIDRRIRDYSRGNVQKLGLVTTFMHEPELVILDEPTAGLDPLMKQRFARFLREEQKRGVTVFFSSHILSEVRRLCNRVGILREGRLITIDPIETLLRRSGKAVRINSSVSVDVDRFDIEGVHDMQTSQNGDGSLEIGFTYTGDINRLLAVLPDSDLIDVAIEEAPLEDIFLRFYGGEEE